MKPGEAMYCLLEALALLRRGKPAEPPRLVEMWDGAINELNDVIGEANRLMSAPKEPKS